MIYNEVIGTDLTAGSMGRDCLVRQMIPLFVPVRNVECVSTLDGASASMIKSPGMFVLHFLFYQHNWSFR